MIASTSFPGWANIYLSPTTLGSITMIITMGFAGGFTGGYFASRGDPFWTISGGLAGVIGVSAGADVYAPTLGYLIAMLTAVLAVYAGGVLERRFRVDDAVGAVAVHGVSGFLGVFWVGVFAAGYPTGITMSSPRSAASSWASRRSCRWASSAGGSPRDLKKLNLLRVPARGRDRRARRRGDGTLIYPEMGVVKEQIVEPDGTLVETATVIQADNGRPPEVERLTT